VPNALLRRIRVRLERCGNGQEASSRDRATAWAAPDRWNARLALRRSSDTVFGPGQIRPRSGCDDVASSPGTSRSPRHGVDPSASIDSGCLAQTFHREFVQVAAVNRLKTSSIEEQQVYCPCCARPLVYRENQLLAAGARGELQSMACPECGAYKYQGASTERARR
jgi:hypothetical protein